MEKLENEDGTAGMLFSVSSLFMRPFSGRTIFHNITTIGIGIIVYLLPHHHLSPLASIPQNITVSLSTLRHFYSTNCIDPFLYRFPTNHSFTHPRSIFSHPTDNLNIPPCTASTPSLYPPYPYPPRSYVHPFINKIL